MTSGHEIGVGGARFPVCSTPLAPRAGRCRSWRLLSVLGLVLLLLPELALAGPRPPRARSVRVTSTPPGAVVRVETAGVLSEPIGATPLRRAKVLPGPQTFVFRLDGYEELRVPVEVKRHGQKVEARLLQAAVLDLTAADAHAAHAEISVDGVPRGVLPQRLQVTPGRHLIETQRDGRAARSQWVEVARGQVLTVAVAVGDVDQGGLLVTADVPGAEVLIGGVSRGKAPFLWADAPPGRVAIEVRALDRPPFRATGEIAAGRRTTVAAVLSGARGGLKVSTATPGAEVWLDGRRLGPAPAGSDDLAPGEHLLEVLAAGHEPLSETVEVPSAQRRLLVVQLAPTEGAAVGPVIVDATPQGAEVRVDGRDAGSVPALVQGLPAGERTVVISAPGHIPVTTRCRVGPGRACRLKAALVAGGERIVVRTSTEGASLYANGVLLGPLPYDGGIAPGSYALEARADNHSTWSQQLTVMAGMPAGVYDASLAELRPEERGIFPHAADALPPRRMALGLSAGWVHHFEARFDVGILSFLDAGVALRTFGRLTEIEARAKAAHRFTPLLSAGAQVRTGGGVGPDEIDSGFFLVEALGSVHLEPRVALTLLLAFDITSDDYPFAETDSDVPAADTERQVSTGFRFGGNVAVAITERWGAFASIEWTPLRSASRRILGDLYGSGDEASYLWFRLGASVVF